MKWAGISPSQEDTFWTNPTVRNLIKNDYKVLVTRKNTFNGKLYGEDDTIFAWDIYNVSARSPGCSHQHVWSGGWSFHLIAATAKCIEGN